MKLDRNILYISVLLAIALWVAEAAVHGLYEESFLGNLLLMEVPGHEIYSRVVDLALILLFGVLMSRAVAKRKTAEKSLAKANEGLENKVAERTASLRLVNDRLNTELFEHQKTAEILRDSEHRLHHISLRLLKVQEKERKEISTELHDEFGQTLAFLKQRLGRVHKKIEEPELRGELKESLRVVDKIIEDVRRISQSLSPQIMEYIGLTAVLQKLISDSAEAYGIRITTDLVNLDHAIPAEAHVSVFRVFQEALNNIGKHALATRLLVSVNNCDNGSDAISFLIEDNGVGFDVSRIASQAAGGRGLGLAILDERVKMLGGSLHVWSQEGKGTRISFTLPARIATPPK